MQMSLSAPWARRWPAGLGALMLASTTAPAAFGAADTHCARPLASAGWHGRAIRAPQPRAAMTVVAWPRGWAAGAVGTGAGYAVAGGSRRVRELQRRLRARGYRPGPVDGRFGPRTRSALQWFEIKHGLPRTCSADARTVMALRSPAGRSPAGRSARGRSLGTRLRLAAAHQPAAGAALAAALVTPQPATGGHDSAALAALVVVLLIGLAVMIAWVRAGTRIPEPHATAPGAVSPARDGQPSATGAGPRPSPPAIPATPDARSVAPAATGSPEPARTPNAPTRRVAGYLTVASGAEGRRQLDGARRELEALCQLRGLELVTVGHDVEPRNDRLANRPGLAHVAERIATGEVSGIVAPRLRDLAGSSITLAGLLGWLRETDAFVIAIDYRLDTTTSAGAHAAHVLIELGEWERTGFTQPSKPGRAAVRSQPLPGQLVALRDHSELRARIVAMRADGMSLQAIADRLNQEGVPTPRGGAEWRISSLQ